MPCDTSTAGGKAQQAREEQDPDSAGHHGNLLFGHFQYRIRTVIKSGGSYTDIESGGADCKEPAAG